MGQYVTDPEVAFLTMMARRVLKYRRAAEQNAQEYHDLTAPWELSCGHAAKLTAVPVAHGYEPEVSVILKYPSSPEAAAQIARDILGAPELALGVSGNTHRFRRKP